MDSKALLRINSLLKHIDLVLTDMKDIDFAHFEEDSLLFRATCFSVSQIG